MTTCIYKQIAVAAIGAIALGGCSNASLPFTTGSLAASAPVVAKTKTVNPACIALRAKIADLRKEGTMARLAKVASGKSRSVRIKRAALGKAAALDSANAEFQTKCSPIGATAALPTTPAAAAVKNAAKSAAQNAATRTATKAVGRSTKTAAALAAASALTNK